MSSNSDFIRGGNEPPEDGGGRRLPVSESDSLVLSKDKVEELAFLLLDLIGKAPKGGLASLKHHSEQLQHTSSSDAQSPLLEPEQETGPITGVVRTLSPPSDLENVSQALLQERPWLQERIIADVGDGGLAGSQEDGIPISFSPEIGAGDESIPLTSNMQPGLVPGIFQENNLYVPNANHAWIDLDTELGPGKFLDEARQYLLIHRASGSWPKVVPTRKRELYITQLWEVLTIGSPAPETRYRIASSLGPRLPTYHTDRASRRPISGKGSKASRKKLGLSAKVKYKAQAISRTIFGSVDPARARLPSTLYLRILGQNLFADCVFVGDDDHGETQLRILIASLKVLAKEVGLEAVSRLTEVVDPQGKPLVSQLASTAPRPRTTVWDLLVFCYHTKALRQPDLGDEDAMRKQALKLVSALQLVNVCTPRLDEVFLQSMQLDSLLGSYIQPLCLRAAVRREEAIYPVGTSEYFGRKDLSVKLLQSVGALNILWTRYIDDHLTLDLDTSELRIFWPAWALANLPCTSLFSSDDTPSTVRDLIATYSFLFYSEYGFQAAINDYNKLDPPSWISTMSGVRLSDLTTFKTLIGDVRYHFMAYNLAATLDGQAYLGMVRFADCGTFENRVRILKGYMDSQRPSGLLALWRDKRDSGQWYTFWLVLVIGGIGIVLAFASLIVTAVQTAFSAEALRCQIESANGRSCSGAGTVINGTTMNASRID